MKTIQNRITELEVALSGDVKKIKATLVLEDYKNSEIEKGIKEAGLKAAAKKGFAGEFYDWLAAEPRGMDEAKDYVMDSANSNNVHNHLSHYLAIAEMALTIHNQ